MLRRVVAAMRDAAGAAGVRIVTGDTKVVPRGAAHRLYVTTAGVGVIPAGRTLAAASVRRPDIVEAEAVDVETGEIIEPTPAPAVPSGPKPLTRTTGNAILAEFKRLGVEAAEVDAWLPALGVPVGLRQLSQPDAEELLATVRLIDRERLAELAREAQGQ